MKKSGWLVLAAFLAGILLANLTEKELLTTYGILNSYFLNQYSYRVVDCDGLFCHVLFERLKTALILFLLGRMLNGKAFFVFVECFAAAGFGFLMVVAIANLGVRGIAVTLAGMFPQWIFYVAAFLVFLGGRQEAYYGGAGRYSGVRENIWGRALSARAGVFVLLTMLLAAGIVTESYINPVLFGKMLKIF